MFNTGGRVSLHFPFMEDEKKRSQTLPSDQVFKWLDAEDVAHGTKANLCRQLGISDQNLTHWRARGIPGHIVLKVLLAEKIPGAEYFKLKEIILKQIQATTSDQAKHSGLLGKLIERIEKLELSK